MLNIGRGPKTQVRLPFEILWILRVSDNLWKEKRTKNYSKNFQLLIILSGYRAVKVVMAPTFPRLKWADLQVKVPQCPLKCLNRILDWVKKCHILKVEFQRGTYSQSRYFWRDSASLQSTKCNRAKPILKSRCPMCDLLIHDNHAQ